MEIVINNKGGLKLMHGGYIYTRKYIKKTVRWECSNRTAFSCKGGVTTNAEVNILCKLPEMRNYRYIADFRYFCLECQIKKTLIQIIMKACCMVLCKSVLS